MPLSIPRPDLDRESAALRRVARALVGDDAAAADLVQDTWLAAIARPPALDRPVRPWLARVLHNRAISSRRAAVRAEARAHASASTTSDIDPEQQQSLRQLLDEIAALSTDDQALLHARFWEGCNATECARRFGCPASTIRTRLARALARLRARLESRAAGRAAWAVVPLRRCESWRPLGLAIGAGAVGCAMLVLAPNGCGAAAVEHASPAAVMVAPQADAAASRTTPRRRARRTNAESPAIAPVVRPRHHPKYAVELAMRDVEEQLVECRSGTGDAIARLRPTIVFSADEAAFVEGVELREHEGLGVDELECLRETFASMAIPPAELDASLRLPWRFVPTTDLIFDEDDGLIRQVVPRGPMKHLATRTEDGSDIRDAVAACDRAGTLRATLTFDPFTGRLVEVEPDVTANADVQQCVALAVRHAVIKGVAFEPRVALDAQIVCTFSLGPEPGDYACARLGPDGGYLDVRTSTDAE
jgi:RNA polymerase sigma factor (sigma-70 family)